MAFELAADRRSVAEIPLKWGPYLAYGNVVLNGGAVLSLWKRRAERGGRTWCCGYTFA